MKVTYDDGEVHQLTIPNLTPKPGKKIVACEIYCADLVMARSYPTLFKFMAAVCWDKLVPPNVSSPIHIPPVTPPKPIHIHGGKPSSV